MANALFSFTPFDFNGTQEGYVPEGYEKDEAIIKGKQDQMLGIADWGEAVNPLFSEYCIPQSNLAKKGVHLPTDEQTLPPPPPPPKSNSSMQTGTSQKPLHPFSSTSLELLSNYGSGQKKLKGENQSNIIRETKASRQELSTEEIMRVAGARYIQFSTQRHDDFAMLMHPFGFALSGLSEEETEDVELVHLLLAAAEKVGYQQFDRAAKLLSHCEWIASKRSNPVQRIVYCFAEALQERIDRETGRITLKGFKIKQENEIDEGLSTNLTSVTCHQQLPFNQVMQFTAIQAILETIASASKVHLIDLEIRSGVQWTVLMQALKEQETCPIQHLKITSVGSTGIQKIVETGRRLTYVAESMNLPFSFKLVSVLDMRDLREEMFEIEKGEVVAVYSPVILRTMLSRPSCLENLMAVIRRLRPAIMVVIEVEASHNSPSFVNRFIEALFFFSAYFDSLETCMGGENEFKMTAESIFRHGIQNIVAMEGSERTTRNVKIEVWRTFFARFRMVEIGFSESSLYQASLVVKRFACASSCSLDRNGKALIIGWKGTPINSVSAWKFR